MIRKVAFLLVLILLLVNTSIIAEDMNKEIEESADRLMALGLVTGYEDGSLRLENPITRAEFITLVVRLICKQDEVESFKGDTIFEDVSKEFWASGYINIAVNEGLINGYPDGTFKPNNKISHGEILTVLVKVLGYEESVNKEEEWPLNYINQSTQLGINTNDILLPNTEATRGEVILYVDKSLFVELNKE